MGPGGAIPGPTQVFALVGMGVFVCAQAVYILYVIYIVYIRYIYCSIYCTLYMCLYAHWEVCVCVNLLKSKY